MAGQVRMLDDARPARRARVKQDPEAVAAFALAKAINRATDRLGPAADTIVGFGHRLDVLCAWLKKWGPWALASVPVIASVVGGAAPEVGEFIGRILKGAVG
jgi:hypothetical protein